MREMLRYAAIPVIAFALLLSSCSDDVVRLPDCLDCRPVEMTLDQTFEADLGWGIRPGQEVAEYTWVVVDPGTMELISTETIERSEGADEFVGGISHGVLNRFQPTAVGTTTIVFELQDADGNPRSDLVAGQESTFTVEVVVTE